MRQKSLLITGCSSGIGRDAALTMHDRGWRVFATCRNPDDCASLIEAGLDSLPLDYSDETGMRATLDEVLARTGGTLDALFNNGAHAVPGATEDLPVAALRDIFEVNLFGWHALTRMVLPVMRAQGHGRVVNCSSVLGIVPGKWRGAYTSTKFALEGLTDTLRLEMGDTPIHVSLIEPGPVTTMIRKNAAKHFEKWVDWENSPRAEQYRDELLKRLYEERGPDWFEKPPAAVTAKLIHALEHPRPKARYYVTTTTWIMSALRRALPTPALDWITTKG